MKNLHHFSIKNKINFESNLDLFKSKLSYNCFFINNNKIIVFNKKDFFLQFKNLEDLKIKKENLYFLGKKGNTLYLGAAVSLCKLKKLYNEQTFSLLSLRNCIDLV